MSIDLRITEDAARNKYGEMLQRELELEERMVTLGRDQIRKNIEKAKQKGNEANTRYGKALVAMSIEKLGEAIVGFIDRAKSGGAGRRHVAVKYLEQLDAEVAAYIAMRCVVDSLTGKKQVLQRAAITIGSRIEDEVRFAAFAKEEAKLFARASEKAKKGTTYERKKATMSGYERRFSDVEWQDWPEQDRLHIGSALIDMIIQTGLVEVGDEIRTRNNSVKVLVPTAKIVDWIEKDAERSELLAPAHMPMIVPPLEWTNPFDGGYLTRSAMGRNAMVKTGNQNYLTELADHRDEMPMVYETLNSLQNTRWKINREVYDVLREVWELGHDWAALPSREDVAYCPCPSCKQPVELPKLNTRGTVEHECFADEEVLRQWKKDAYECHSTNVSLRSKRLHVAKTLKIADIYAEEEALFFPYQLDFRGRIYCIPSFNPQGDDVNKGLLTFADGMAIEDGVAAGWLAIQGANVFGFDKAALEDRIGWVEDHEVEILASAEDPLHNRFWQEADKPWQFLAFCFEWAGFCKEGYGFVSHLPVALDGSCSGIQHFSAMLRDEVGGKAVNLIPADKPEDIYQIVCDKVVEKLEAIAVSAPLHTGIDTEELSSTIAYSYGNSLNQSPSSDEEEEQATTIATAQSYSDAEFAAKWLALKPNRKTTKRQVMTLPYGSTMFSCREYTEQWMKEEIAQLKKNGVSRPWPKTQDFKASQFMAKLIWEAIGETVIAARAAMNWLQQCAKVVAAEELPVYWTTPVGFRVMQSYRNTKSKRVKTKLGDAIVKLSLTEDLATLDKKRMANAISPNFVHSMDATHLIMSVAYAALNGVKSFAMIHDSFGTHAANTNLLAATLREAFVDLYSDLDVLEDFRQQILRQVAEEDESKVPELPAKGNLVLEEVRESDFFFA